MDKRLLTIFALLSLLLVAILAAVKETPQKLPAPTDITDINLGYVQKEKKSDEIGKEALQELINWECSDENPYKLYLLNCPLESTNKD